MSFERPGLLALLALGVGLLGLLAPSAQAGELDSCFAEMRNPAAQRQALDPESAAAADLDRTTQGDLQPIEDFHPETDRWTERTNRIRISPWVAVWWFSGELDIHNDIAIGGRISWEVPGFIGIRLDHGIVPWARMEVKGVRNGGTSSRWMSGFVHSHTLSLGIFNPELSIDGLAFWAGFGMGLWFYNFDESDVFNEASGVDASFDDTNFAFNIFLELDYKITDILHVGIGFREHIIFASHTDDGRFYEFNGVEQSGNNDGRNDGILDDLATVTELTFTVSVLF